QRAWLAFCASMAARGVPRRRSEGPRDFAQRSVLAVPSLRDRIENVARLYIRLRYGRGCETGLIAQLRAAVASIEH
ncbi:MAG: DUF4129 domain-containing protein, partial [Burkholderiales bacterium]